MIQILHNPRYAGAFAYGRTRTIYNAKFKSVQQKMPVGRVRTQSNKSRTKCSRLFSGPAASYASPRQRLIARKSFVRSLRRSHAGPLRTVRGQSSSLLHLQRGRSLQTVGEMAPFECAGEGRHLARDLLPFKEASADHLCLSRRGAEGRGRFGLRDPVRALKPSYFSCASNPSTSDTGLIGRH